LLLYILESKKSIASTSALCQEDFGNGLCEYIKEMLHHAHHM
jgi:hypothetical protein